MITREKLNNYLYSAVELEDCNNCIKKGWFVPDKIKNQYALLPFIDIWHIYVYRISHIKRIKFLTNGYEIK